MNDRELKLVLRQMLETELEAMLYYQQAAEQLQNAGADFHFNLLAREEQEHARVFYEVYPGDDLPVFEQLIAESARRLAQPPQSAPAIDTELTKEKALEVALKMEKSVAENLQQRLKEVQLPAARAVIEENLASTLEHMELIELEYQRITSGH